MPMTEPEQQLTGHEPGAIPGTRSVATALLICWVLIIIWLSLTPSPPKMPNKFLGWDKLQHASAYAVMMFLGVRAFAYSGKAIWPVFIGVVCFGGAMEIAQSLLTSHRTADILDLVANMTGAAAVWLMHCFSRRRKLATGSCNTLFMLTFVAAVLGPSGESWGGESAFAPVGEMKSAAVRIADEAVEIGKAPFGIENNGLLTTALVAGSIAVTALYDEDIRDKVATRKGGNLDRAADIGSFVGDPFVHLGIAAAVYSGGILGDSPKYKELGEMLGEAALLADASTLILKQTIGRGRPSASGDSGSFRPFQFRTDYDSLPSMHTASSFAMASVVASAADSPITAIASYAAATFVGFSRIYQNKHWASDILLGAAIGELCGRVVTRYHATARYRSIAIAPVVSDSSALLALVGRF
ncbi:PAP2 superfamily protein [Geobacter sp. OR-1]|uniref:VanZ family protein n=1 Tax=Geobacter sp. OR-1 TaxID=1266765 RepID=UPI0005435BDA|nr:VanZ family protein [Geobacter sp. OR-1]GAM10827.1 PAP2 superfamily protein [Geobacter sp. OR-1]